MRGMNPRKLLLSKWTAVKPLHREKHFLVTDCQRDDEGNIVAVEIEAVLTRRSETLPWRQLQDPARWRAGWH